MRGFEGVVAGDTDDKKAALNAARAVGQSQVGGISPGMIRRQLENVQGQQLGAQQGALGSARAARARESALADQAIGLQQASDQRRAQGLQALSGVAEDRQAQAQAKLDAPQYSGTEILRILGICREGTNYIWWRREMSLSELLGSIWKNDRRHHAQRKGEDAAKKRRQAEIDALKTGAAEKVCGQGYSH